MEIWKDIKGYEGLYQVSDLGRVKSLSRVIRNKAAKCGLNNIKERVLRPSSYKGYPQVTLSKDGKIKTISIHKLMAIAFLNHKPNGCKNVIDHINNNSLDNRLENLQIITNRENTSKDRSGGSSKYIGVSWYKRDSKWMAQIVLNGKNINLGYYKSEKVAAGVYQHKLKQINNII